MAGSDDIRANILVLDDDELWLRSCVRRIRQRGGRAMTFTEPEEALQALSDRRFRIGMIDYHLGPGWTGARFAERAQAVLGQRCPPLMLVSGALEQVPMAERELFVGAYPKATPAMALLDEVFAIIAEARRGPSSHSQLRVSPAERKRYNTPT